jgi:predicted GNAT family N-acyltransferase
MQSITFTANYVKPVNIKRFNGKKYVKDEVNLVEIQSEDIMPMRNITRNWKNAEYATGIYRYFLMPTTDSRIYAITEQKQNFQNLQAQQILGVMLDIDHSKEEQRQIVGYLQVKPSEISSSYGKSTNRIIRKLTNIFSKHKNAAHKNIGKAFVEALKSLHPQDEISLVSDPKAVGFYKELGFKPDKDEMLTYRPPHKK